MQNGRAGRGTKLPATYDVTVYFYDCAHDKQVSVLASSMNEAVDAALRDVGRRGANGIRLMSVDGVKVDILEGVFPSSG